jgi:hypothetical protein
MGTITMHWVSLNIEVCLDHWTLDGWAVDISLPSSRYIYLVDYFLLTLPSHSRLYFSTMASLQSYFYAFVVLGTSLCFLRPSIIYLLDPLALRRFPKPHWTVGLSALWLVRITWSQKRSRILHEHFQNLGDVIRVAPNQIIFNTPEAIKDIYGVMASTRGVVKDELYHRMAGDGAHDLVQLRDRNEHSSRRKAIANAFAAKTVVNMEPVIRKAVAQLIENLDGFVEEKKTLNIRYW